MESFLAAQDADPVYTSGMPLFVGLFNNLALLIVFVAGYGFLNSRLRKVSRWLRQALMGIAFSIFVFGCMQVRIPAARGVIVDQRNAVVIMAGIFGGPLSAAICALIAASYRVYLGGVGIWGGTLGICLSAIAGTVLKRLWGKKDSVWKMAVGSVAAAVFILPGFLPIESWERGWALMKAMAVPYGSAISIGIFLGSALLANEERRGKVTEDLKASEKRYRGLFESSIDMIHRSDGNGDLLIASPSSERLIGYKPEELVGKPANFFFRDPERTRASLIEKIRPTGSVKDFEAEVVRKDGTVISVSTNARVVIGESGKIMGIEGITRDITQLKRAEEEKRRLEESLLQSQKMESVGSLAGGIAHDFNNILTAVIGFSDLAKSKLPPDSPVREDIDGIVSAGMRAKELVQHILLFSRKGTGKKIPVRIRLVLRDAYSLLRASIPSTIEIKQDLRVDEGSVLADSTALHQVIMNLCTNAAQAMEEKGGVMTIRLDRVVLDGMEAAAKPGLSPGPYFSIAVSDTGVGIDPADMEKIFDPYFTTKAIGKGTGMGLAVVHGIVESHGGMITARSQPGKGSTFTVYFPEIGESPAEAVSLPATLPRGAERILLVDDEESLVHVTSLRLEMLGYHVASFTDSAAALEAFKARPREFDLVLTDMTMPTLTGPGLASAVRGIRPDIPVILCTGYSSPSDRRDEWIADVDEIIMKPIGYGELAAALRRLLDGGKGAAGKPPA